MKKVIVRTTIVIVVIAVAIFGLLQLVPYNRNHTNPPMLKEPQWDSTQTRQLAQRACFDCHSNETVWPWYSNVAPVSWLVQKDVDEGRSRFNFSEWGRGGADVNEIVEIVGSGEMPPAMYVMMHPSANLSSTEKQALLNGFQASLGSGGK